MIVAAGTADDHAALLPDLATGARVGTIALYEPEQRTEWRTPVTTATATGDTWTVTGTKAHVADAVAADLILVVAAPDGPASDALGVFAVDAGSTSVTVEPHPTVDGTRKQATVRLDQAPSRRLGAGDATGAIADVVDRLGVAAVVDGVGAAARALEIAVDYAKERRQFNQPIGAFQAVQHLCADMLRAVELARAGAYYACWAADAADPSERHRAATVARAFAADELYRVGASAIQVHGGLGFTWEHDIHLFYKRLLTLQHDGGGATDHLEELATLVLDA
jgi:alkylation response protein AidB-like acyl-CoA dehydrogenase